jgi:ABC-type sugar transport system substrate-binding protein
MENMYKEAPSIVTPLKFILIRTCIDEDFLGPVRWRMCDAAEMLDVECNFTGTPEVDIPAQMEMVRDAIKVGVDGIALNIIDPEAFDKVIAQAMDGGTFILSFMNV